MTAPVAFPDLGVYRRFVLAFSDGKTALSASCTSSVSCGRTRWSCITMVSTAKGPTFVD